MRLLSMLLARSSIFCFLFFSLLRADRLLTKILILVSGSYRRASAIHSRRSHSSKSVTSSPNMQMTSMFLPLSSKCCSSITLPVSSRRSSPAGHLSHTNSTSNSFWSMLSSPFHFEFELAYILYNYTYFTTFYVNCQKKDQILDISGLFLTFLILPHFHVE